MKTKKVLITGGDGYLGLRLARKYLEATEDSVILWIRARDREEFQRKKEKINNRLHGLKVYAERSGSVGYLWGDLTEERPFDSINPQEIRLIIHAAAVTRFNVDKITARKVNVEGTEKVFHFANRCSFLEGIGLLSTVYASGLKSGVIEEVPMDDKGGFANYYEWSKWATETQLLTQFNHLPWRIFRIATIIADNDTGQVTQQNAFHNTLKLFHYGLLSLVPGKPETPLYFITGDFVTDAVFTLMTRSLNKSIYHVVPTQKESPSGQTLRLGELIDLAFGIFEQERDFKLRRILKPLYADARSFDLLAEGVQTFGTGTPGSIMNQAISSVAPFAKQLFVQKEIQNQNLALALANRYHAPNIHRLIQNTCKYLVRTKWGKSPEVPR